MKRSTDTVHMWQHCDEALWLLLALLVALNLWCWSISLPLALSAREHTGAVENLLTSFGFTAAVVAFLAVAYRKPKLLIFGGVLLGVGFYASSIFLSDVVKGPNIGVAIRVGAMAVVAFGVAGGLLASKAKHAA